MPQFNVTDEEWKIAHQFLDYAPDGTKLPFSVERDSKNQIKPRGKFKENPKGYQTFHSFIKKNGEIYAFQRGSLGEGVVNKAKFVINESKELFVVKVSNGEHPLSKSETDILLDLQLSKGILKRADENKEYVFIKSLGISLKSIFAKNAQPTKLEERLEMAIQLTWKLYRLHEGFDSATRTPYAHMDIKPDNITMTPDGQLHFIDFGMAEKYPGLEGRQKTQAHTYVAYCDRSKDQVLTKEQYDVIAVKRVIHLPDSLYGGGMRYISNIYRDDLDAVSLLTWQELDKLKLSEYINTFSTEDNVPDYTKDETTGIMLCAMLINARYDLKLDQHEIANDRTLIHAITGFYFNDQRESLANLLSDPIAIKLMAGLNALDIRNHYHDYRSDTDLCDALARASTFEMARALVVLKMNGLEAYYDTVLGSNELSEVIYVLVRDEGTQDKNNLLTGMNDKSLHITKAILFLKQRLLDKHINRVINDLDLATALVTITSAECEACVTHMLTVDGFSADQIIKASQDERLAKAANMVWSNDFVNRDKFFNIVKLMVTNTASLDACLNIADSKLLNDFERSKILADSNKCEAFNYLFTTNSMDKESLTSLIYSEDTVRIFARLKEHNMDSLILRALQDFNFRYEVQSILNGNFAKDVTVDMLANDKARKCITEFYGSADKFKGLKILLEMKLLDKIPGDSLHSIDFVSIWFLKEKGFTSFIKWAIDYPDTGYHLSRLLAKEHAASHTYHFYSILHVLPSEKRFAFIQEIAKVLEIKSLRSHKRYWQEMKALLSQSDKQAFSKMIYSESELADKQTLKNIKQTIKTTSWAFSFYDSKVGIAAGKINLDVPSSVIKHISILHGVSSGSKTHSEGINEIKQLGRQQFKERQGMFTYYKHSLFGKSETAKYFDKFETDETFEKAFVKKG